MNTNSNQRTRADYVEEVKRVKKKEMRALGLEPLRIFDKGEMGIRLVHNYNSTIDIEKLKQAYLKEKNTEMIESISAIEKIALMEKLFQHEEEIMYDVNYVNGSDDLQFMFLTRGKVEDENIRKQQDGMFEKIVIEEGFENLLAELKLKEVFNKWDGEECRQKLIKKITNKYENQIQSFQQNLMEKISDVFETTELELKRLEAEKSV